MALSETLIERRFTPMGEKRQVLVVALFGSLFLASSISPHYFVRTIGITPASVLLALVLLVFASRCGPDPFHPARLLAVVLGLGFVAGPIVHAVTGRYTLPDGAARQAAQLPRAEWMVLAGALLSFLAMRVILGDGWDKDLRRRTRDPISDRSLKAALVVAVLGIAMLTAYLALAGIGAISLQGRGASYAVVAHEGRRAYLALLAPISLGGILVVVARALEQRSRVGLLGGAATAIIVGAAMALPGSRANFLYAVAPLALLYAVYRGLPRAVWVVTITLVLLLALFYAAAFRNADTRSEFAHDPGRALIENRPRVARAEDFFLTDLAHTEPLLATMDAYPATRPFLGGESVALGFTGPAGWKFTKLIDLRVDPPSGVTATATAYGRDPSTFGAGLTATLPGELYANAGVLGVLIGLAIFGAVAAASRRRALNSTASGSVVLYAIQLTIIFAIFADYIGQFYRVGAVLVGGVIALISGGERNLSFARGAVIVILICGFSAALLVARRTTGAPPATILTSMIPVYLVLAGVAVFATLRLARSHIFSDHVPH